MRKIRLLCVALLFFCLLAMLSGCSHADYGVGTLGRGACSLRAVGRWQGVEVDALVSCDAESGDFCISFSSGSLAQITVRRSGGKVRIFRGGVEEREFYFGGLCALACLFAPDSVELVRVEREGEREIGVLSARSVGLSYEMRTTGEGVPLSVSGEDFFLAVEDYIRQ